MIKVTSRQLFSSYFESTVVRFMIILGLSPNSLTLIGFSIAIVTAFLIVNGHFVAGGMTLIVHGIFDLLDGAVARATNRVTKFGSLFDSVTDRASESTILIGLLVFYLVNESSPISEIGAVLSAIALVGSTMVSYVRARAEGLGIKCEIGIMTRPERIATLSLGIIIGGLWYSETIILALGIITLLTTVTTIQRVLHVQRKQT